MALAELQPYLAVVSATFSIATLGFILVLVKQVRENAQDRAAVQEERLKSLQSDLERTEKWHAREKQELQVRLDALTVELNDLLRREGIDLRQLALGRGLSEAAAGLRQSAQRLVDEMAEKLERFSALDRGHAPPANPKWQLSAAMGAMAAGAFATASHHFDAYAQEESAQGEPTWETHFSRGVAHANARGGLQSDLAGLRAYNEAIAVCPAGIEPNIRARMFAYRGAMLKRLGRLQEAEADLRIGRSLASEPHEVEDIRYNLACVFALQGARDEMLAELRPLAGNKKYAAAVRAHRNDYFARFADDAEFKALIAV
jgi:hypothetical protein